MIQDDDDVFDDLSFSFFMDRNNHGYIDSDENIVNNYKKDKPIPKPPSMENVTSCISPPDPLNHLSKRTREKWVEDSSVSKCHQCKCTFRIYRRRHHCILEGTPVTLSNGMARKIEDIYPCQKVPSWNDKLKNIEMNEKEVDALLDQGYEECMKLTLEDGRELIATGDHEILAITPTCKDPHYVELKNLTENDRIICSTLQGVLDDPSLDTVDYVIPGTNLSILKDRDKCLAFARICGYVLTDGNLSETSNRVVFLMGDQDDAEAICKDLEMLINNEIKRPELQNTGKSTIYRVEFHDKNLKTYFENVGITIGNKVNKGMRIPNFMWDDKCPKSIQREFIAGWFGGDGSRFGTDGKSLSTSSHTVSVSTFENDPNILEDSINSVKRMNDIINSFGISSEAIGFSSTMNDECKVGIILNDILKFNENIGFRYCIEKQSKTIIKVVYKNCLKNSCNSLTFTEFLNQIGFDWDAPSRYGKRYFSLKIISKSPYVKSKVYDLSVPGNVSFVANGIVVHNCYNCALIFCDACTPHRSKIPKVIKKVPTRSGTEEPIDYNTPVRLCQNCFNFYETIHKLEKLLTVFSLMDLNIFDYRNLSMVCKAWRPMALFYLSKFREIQYKLPKYSYNNSEKQALWSNRFLLKGHSIWEVHVIRAHSPKEPKNAEKFTELVKLYYSNPVKNDCIKNNKECWNRMCSRYCSKVLDPERALMLLDALEFNEYVFSLEILEREIVKAFDLCDDYILECYILYILDKIIRNKCTIIEEWIYDRCKKSIRIANCTYWFLKNNSSYHLCKLCEILPQKHFTLLVKSASFLELLKENKKIDQDIVSPVNPEFGEQKIDIKGITVKKSATRPSFIPCNKSSILYKEDDIRKDQIIMSVIRLMEKILQDAGLNISIVTYNVQPTSKYEGFIQIVPDCDTLYDISENLKSSIINYLLSHNPNESVSNLRNRFKNSCAIYSVIAFLLSISDRNTENLMLTNKGDFFEIDYGFVLSLDPKILKTSCVRITSQMLEALGGENSKEYEEFKDMCAIVYDILRKHVNTFVCLLSLIPTFKGNSRTSPDIDEKQMYSEIVKRFCPGETYEDAIKNLKTRIDNSTDNSTLSKYHIIDFFHKHNKEATVSTFLEGTLSTAYSGTKYLVGGLSSYFYSFS